MATDAPPSLSDDIQRALQQAIGDANNAANVVKKKHKRTRDTHSDHSDGPSSDRTVKKKKKSHATPEVSAEPLAPIDLPVVNDAVAQAAPEGDGGKKKKKKKEKGKGKERASEQVAADSPQPPTEEASSSDLHPTSMDFISAVVAAASATAGQPSLQYDQQMPPPFMEYPNDFGGYPYPPPPHSAPYSQPHQPPLYADPDGGFALTDLNFTSSEDLLRSIQDFDLNKVMSVLRSLGEAANVANVSLNAQPVFLPGPPPGPPPVNQSPVRSDALLGRPQQQPVQHGAPPVHDPPPVGAQFQHENPEHAHMLANVWMNAAKLAEMVKKEGLVYKKGKFSAIEEAQLTGAIENYRSNRGLSEEDLRHFIFTKGPGHESFWSEITSALHLRPIIAVYHHVRRTYHPLKQQGRWVKAEDEVLRKSVDQFGQQWEKVSLMVGRTSYDCRDRYRNHIQDRELRISGAWSRAEEEELTRIVTEMTIEQGKKDIDNDIFWGVVSQRMGNRRGRQQCRIKWTDSLSMQMKNMGERPRWSQTDAYILVHKIDSLNVRDDSEIDWKLLPDEHWNVWSAHSLQRRWMTMKRGIKGHEEMSHTEIMEILKTKKTAQSPPPPSTSTRKKKSKVTSNAAVTDLDDADLSSVLDPSLAGPSNGPGTLTG